ncbi:MAG: NAD(P)-dependent oxidoreductase [Acidobacteria bacterium]|nr:NAD(P)-dependent oxidoreductase [Acidobacteriota bacterium]
MTILIIGAGLVGAQVASILAGDGERPLVMDRQLQRDVLATIVDLDRIDLIEGDVLRPLTLSAAVVRGQIDAIVHTAANPLLTLGAQRNPYAAIELNIMGLANVMEAARIHGIRRVVASSSSVLNRYQSGGEDGGDLSKEEAVPRPHTFYASTKQAVESIGLNYAKSFGIEFAALRYCPVAGPWSGPGGGGPSGIFRAMLENAVNGREAVVPGTAMEWVYSKDAAHAPVLALRAASLGSGVFNITMGRIFRPDELEAELKRAIPGARTRVEAQPEGSTWSGGDWKPADISRARKTLGYEPRYPMPRLLADYAAWYRNRAATA